LFGEAGIEASIFCNGIGGDWNRVGVHIRRLRNLNDIVDIRESVYTWSRAQENGIDHSIVHVSDYLRLGCHSDSRSVSTLGDDRSAIYKDSLCDLRRTSESGSREGHCYARKAKKESE
jgi:hypothetical protein